LADLTDLHADDGVDEEEHDDQQGNVWQSLHVDQNTHIHLHVHSGPKMKPVCLFSHIFRMPLTDLCDFGNELKT